MPAQGYSVWALDARGYGGTRRDVSDWLHERTGQQVNVWGWSYGAMVAQLTAQRYPQAIRSVTLFGYPTDPDVEVPVLLLQAEFDPLANTDAHARLFVNIANPNKQWVVLAGGDHAALLETPRARLIEASVDFIEWLAL